uniref:Protein Wnt n=1 Tax=Ciona savignyi TaxID=51511 RepID=H2Y6S1_CIOSA
LTTSQRRKCKRDPGMPQVLTEATHIAAAECQHQFRDERWNCSLGTSRIHILNKGNRETAFLFSISSAGLTHAVARACANGHLKRCSCDDSYDSHVTDGSWRWDGCGDNVHYAAKFVRRFLKSRSTSRDIRAEVDKHNSDLGIRVVKSNVKVTCKCHGVSGSCTTKTCWRKMAPFYEIGRKIKRAYDKAVKVRYASRTIPSGITYGVGSINNSNGRARLIRLRRSRLRHRKLSGGSSITSSLTRHTLPPVSPTPDSRLNLVANTYRTTTPRATLNPREELKGEIPRNKELVYLEKSPTYCRKSRYSKGTKGRVCKDERSCDKVCCGRGYTTHVRLVRRSCQCEVKWCCAVHCNTCSERKKIHTCK